MRTAIWRESGKQVGDGSGWMRIVRLKEKGESTEVYLFSRREKIGGCLVMVAEPKELTVAQVTGAATMVKSNIKYDLSVLLKQGAAQ